MIRPLKIGYLVIGLVFIGIAASWGLHANGVLDDNGFQWFVPATLLVAGLVGLFASLGRGVAGRKKPAYDENQPVLDLTSDLDRKLADTTVIHTDINTEGTNS
jgi:hypothetical protein